MNWLTSGYTTVSSGKAYRRPCGRLKPKRSHSLSVTLSDLTAQPAVPTTSSSTRVMRRRSAVRSNGFSGRQLRSSALCKSAPTPSRRASGMLHSNRIWVVVESEGAERLAHQLTQYTWCGCNGFRLNNYVFVNDSTSADGAQEYA